MPGIIRHDKHTLTFENERITVCFNITNGLSLQQVYDPTAAQSLGSGPQQTLVLEQKTISLAQHQGTEVRVQNISPLFREGHPVGNQADIIITLPLPGGGQLTIHRHFSFYDRAGALRWFDTWSSDTALHGLRYSDLVSFRYALPGQARAVDFFNCSDQSNERVRTYPAEKKNPAAFFLHNGGSGLFIYKEGPSPDCQPIPTEFDFGYDADSAQVSMVGLGFDDLRPGETRRANGVVIGILEDEHTGLGLKRYQQERYPLRELEPPEFLCNSWPAFFLNIDEEKILGEIEAGSESGVDTVFIDDGWFDLFMGDIHPEKFPQGFGPLVQRARERGVNLGLWVNPLGLDCQHPKAKEWDGAECHDAVTEGNKWNWVARSDDFTPVEKRFSEKTRIYHGMDLLNSDYFEHIRAKLIRFYTEHGIRRFKFDLYQLNRYNTLLGDAHLHYEAYRHLLDELHEAIPGLMVSMDVTRRHRPCFDFGMDYGRLFLENRGRRLNDHRYYQPYVSLGNLWRVAHYIPAQRCELEMMPQIDDYPLDYILATTLFAHPLYWGSMAELSPQRRADIKAWMNRFSPHKQQIMKHMIFPFGDEPGPNTWSGFLSLDTSCSQGYVALYRNGGTEDTRRMVLPLPATLHLDRLQPELAESDVPVLHGGIVEGHIGQEYGFALYSFTAVSVDASSPQ